jgi:type VI secretion system protein ImpH
MVPASGAETASLSDRVLKEPWRFDFFQAVRLMEASGFRVQGSGAASSLNPEPGTLNPSEEPRTLNPQPVGYDSPPDHECARFHSLVSLSFPPCMIAEALPREGNRPPVLVVSFLGLAGPQGVMPRHYTSLLLERLKEKDFAGRDFLDLFNHRLVSLFYRAWEKNRFFVGYERTHGGFGVQGSGNTASSLNPEPRTLKPQPEPRTLNPEPSPPDLFTQCLFSLIGLGAPSLRGRMDFPDEAMLRYAGHLAHRPRSAVALEQMLADYFGVPAGVQQFQGQWLYLSREARSCMATPEHPRGMNMALGLDTVVGESIWDVQSRIRIRLGAVSYRSFQRFLPGGRELRALFQLARLFVGPEFDFDVQVVLMAREVPPCRLGESDQGAAQLGYNCWLEPQSLDNDRDDAVFVLDI